SYQPVCEGSRLRADQSAVSGRRPESAPRNRCVPQLWGGRPKEGPHQSHEGGGALQKERLCCGCSALRVIEQVATVNRPTKVGSTGEAGVVLSTDKGDGSCDQGAHRSDRRIPDGKGVAGGNTPTRGLPAPDAKRRRGDQGFQEADL